MKDFLDLLEGDELEPSVAEISEHRAHVAQKIDKFITFMNFKPSKRRYILESAMERMRFFQEEGAETVSDFPALFGTVIDRQLKADYKIQTPVYKNYVKVGTQRDFRAQNIIGVFGLQSNLSSITELGPYSTGKLADGKVSNVVKKYGRVFPLSWEAIINDDLGAFSDAAQRLANAARRTEYLQATKLISSATGPNSALFGSRQTASKDQQLRVRGVPEMTTKSPAKSVDERIQKRMDAALYAGGRPSAQKIRNFLNGTWLGEPLHVVLKDVPIGAWTVAMIFDVFDSIGSTREFALAAEASIAIGILGAVGAAATGLTDWSDVDPPARKMGLLHGVLNVGATALFTTSLLLRRNKNRAAGRVMAALGYSLVTYSAHLGGKMVYKHRVGVDRTDGLVFPENFTPILSASELSDDRPTRAMHKGVPILLVRRGQGLFAMAETCSHFGGPLSEGKLVDGSIECPYHLESPKYGSVVESAPGLRSPCWMLT